MQQAGALCRARCRRSTTSNTATTMMTLRRPMVAVVAAVLRYTCARLPKTRWRSYGEAPPTWTTTSPRRLPSSVDTKCATRPSAARLSSTVTCCRSDVGSVNVNSSASRCRLSLEKNLAFRKILLNLQKY